MSGVGLEGCLAAGHGAVESVVGKRDFESIAAIGRLQLYGCAIVFTDGDRETAPARDFAHRRHSVIGGGQGQHWSGATGCEEIAMKIGRIGGVTKTDDLADIVDPLRFD